MRLHILLIIVLLLAAGAAGSSIQITETLLTPWGTPQYDPVISGSYVAYVDRGGGNEDICIYTIGAPGNPVHVNYDPSQQFDPAIDGDRVVYVDEAAGKGDIWLHEISSGQSTKLTYGASDEVKPQISGDNVVYLSDRSGNWDVYTYSLSEWRELPLVLSAYDEELPSIDDETVAWQVLDDGTYNIRAKTLGGTEFPVATSAADETYPKISGDKIALRINGEIALYDIATAVTDTLPNSDGLAFQLFLDEQHITYTNDSTGNWDIFLYDIADSTTYQLTSNPFDQFLTGVDGNRVVFWDERNGSKDVWLLEWEINHPPVADAGADQYVDEGDTVYLSGSGSDPNGDPIVEWRWSFTDLPFGSAAELDDPAIQSPSFVADVAGDYVLSLVVSDGTDPSDPDEVTITAEAPCAEPVAVLDVDPTEGETPLTVTFDASSSYDPYYYPLYFEWDFGDGSPPETDPVVVHTYTESDEFDASLYLYNDCGMNVLVPITIQVSATGVPDDEPLVFALYPSSPNPFSQGTTIAYDLAYQSEVALSIYDVSGRLVRRLRSGAVEGPGRYEAGWDGCDAAGNTVAAGTYIYRLEASGYEASGRMTLVK